MTARAFTEPVVDPSGLGGAYEHGSEVSPNHFVEVWRYPAAADVDAIERAWKSVRFATRTLVLSCTAQQPRAGWVLVSVRMWVEPAKAPVHIDEPNDL